MSSASASSSANLSPQSLTNSTAQSTASLDKPIGRIASIDVYRGMVMFLMLAEVLHWSHLKDHKEGFAPWIQQLFEWISFHTSHVAWRGCSLHDMIQPSFSFLVGTALAFSIASRNQRGQPWMNMFGHALFRSVILVLLGIFLRSLNSRTTNFTFDDTLTQIGLGYWALFLLSRLSIRGLAIALSVVLVGYWALFVAYPLPAADFPYESVGVPANWPEHFSGFQSHWNKNSNLAASFDTWWMNLFPREKVFLFSGGGYCTLSFIPTLGTMILGLIAGKILLESKWQRTALTRLIVAAVICVALAFGIDQLGLCPIVKRIWTPTWTLWSGGLCLLWLAALHAVCDRFGAKAWGFPFIVIGANSIVAYVMSWTIENSTKKALETHFGWLLDRLSSEAFRPMLIGVVTLVFFWLVLYWLYKQKIFVRI